MSISVYCFLRGRADELRALGRERGAEALVSALRALRRFSADVAFDAFDAAFVARFEAHLRGRGLCRNTTSFYMRTLRAAYSVAVDSGITADLRPFSRVYTGIDRTVKRAVSPAVVRGLNTLDLSGRPHLAWARDLFLFSFYARGMSFVDIAYLRKSDLSGNYITYRRRKTGQTLVIEVTEPLRAIIERWPSANGYLLPVITRYDGTERRQYRSQLARLNRNLKVLGAMVDAPIALTSYCSRHGWATIARDLDIPIAVISQGLGHDNPHTTQIYLAQLQASVIDEANRRVIERVAP